MRYERSLDRKRLLLIGTLDRLKDSELRSQPAEYHYAQLSSDRDTVRRGLIKLPYTYEQFDLEHARIHSGNNIYLVGRFEPKGDDDDYYERKRHRRERHRCVIL